jgi:hypothetical protein
MLAVAGVIIHLLQDKDLILAALLAVGLVLKFLRPGKKTLVYTLGVIFSAIGGVLAEKWGISNGLWEYHDLPEGRTFPYWLPFAWGHAFSFMYSFERNYIKLLNITSPTAKIGLAVATSAILPTAGEIVAVQCGVWTYYGPFQILGIPLYAIGLLVLFHTGIYLVLAVINAKYQIGDAVFNLSGKKYAEEI